MAMLGGRNPFALEPQESPQPRASLAGILADALSGLAGQPGMYAQRVARDRAEQTALERGEQQYRRQRADAQTDWERNKQWELANQKPETWEDNGGNRWTMQDGKPVKVFTDEIPKERWVFDPVRGYVNINAMSQPSQPRRFDALPKGAVPLGGQTPPASGGFPDIGPYRRF